MTEIPAAPIKNPIAVKRVSHLDPPKKRRTIPNTIKQMEITQLLSSRNLAKLFMVPQFPSDSTNKLFPWILKSGILASLSH